MTNSTTATLIATTISLNRAETLIPMTRMAVSSSTTITAGRLNTVPSPPAIAAGRCNPSVWRKTARYCDQPTATAAPPMMNSSSRSHPMIHAISSPRVAYP